MATVQMQVEEPLMEINIPEVVAEVRAAFLRYQKAVDTQDVAVMNELFWTSPFTVRFGPNGTLIGHDAIANYRQNSGRQQCRSASAPEHRDHDLRPRLCRDQHRDDKSRKAGHRQAKPGLDSYGSRMAHRGRACVGSA